MTLKDLGNPNAPLNTCVYSRIPWNGESWQHAGKSGRYQEMIENTPGLSYAGLYTETDKHERLALDKMLQDCRAGEIDLVVVQSFNSISRDETAIVATINALNALSIGLFFDMEGIYTKDEIGRMLLRVFDSPRRESSQLTHDRPLWGANRGMMQ